MPLLQPSRNSSKLSMLPAPLGGLNAYDNLAAMPPTDAIRLNNFVPQPYGCAVRKGCQKFSTGLGAPVETLASWNARSGQSKLFAVAGGNFYECTIPGPVGAALLSGLNSNFWQSTNFANAAGSHLIMVDGADDPIWYSLAGVQRLIPGDGIANGTIAGANPADFIQVTVHQRRLWFVPINSTLGWYLPPDAVFGTVNFFDFGPFFKRGGYLSTLATWTVDAGTGSNDKLVAISSRGEAVVFQGTDVSNAATWSLVGVYFIGSPIRGRRYFTNVAGDILYLTGAGVVSLSTVLVSTQVNATDAAIYSKKVQFALSEIISDLADIEGWELQLFPSQDFLVINIPTINAGSNGQLVNNTTTNAWCTFTGYDARTFHNYGGVPFFGDPDGNVMKAWIGDLDYVGVDGSGGTSILANSQQAYTQFGAPSTQKQVGLYKPTFSAVAHVDYNASVIYDYVDPRIAAANATAAQGGASLWGVALWGSGVWSGGSLVQREWRSGAGLGTAVSLLLTTTTAAETVWIGTDYTYRTGGPL